MFRRFVSMIALVWLSSQIGLAQDLVQNGDFEDEDGLPLIELPAGTEKNITEWVVTRDNVNYVQESDAENGFWTPGAMDVRCIELNGTEAGGIEQEGISLAIEDEYELSFQMAGDYSDVPDMGETGARHIRVYVIDEDNFVLKSWLFTHEKTDMSPAWNRATQEGMQWERKVLEFTSSATVENHKVIFQSRSPGAYGPIIDDVEITLAGP